MTAKTVRGAAAANGEDTASPINLVTDLPRRQLAMLSQSASTLYRGSEALRQIQQQAAERASRQHQEAAEKLRDSRDFGEVMAIQTELLRFNLQESAQYWQQLATAVLKLQSEMISGTRQVLDPGSDPTLDALQRAFADTLNSSASAAATH
ncbi:MAG: phasin family protein [Ramlibacter sp.]